MRLEAPETCGIPPLEPSVKTEQKKILAEILLKLATLCVARLRGRLLADVSYLQTVHHQTILIAPVFVPTISAK